MKKDTININVTIPLTKLTEIALWAKKNGHVFTNRSKIVSGVFDLFYAELMENEKLRGLPAVNVDNSAKYLAQLGIHMVDKEKEDVVTKLGGAMRKEKEHVGA